MFSYYILTVLAVLSPRNMEKLADKWQETLERQLWQLLPLFSPSTCQVFSERQLEVRTHCEKYPMVLQSACHFLWMNSCSFPKQNFSLSRERWCARNECGSSFLKRTIFKRTPVTSLFWISIYQLLEWMHYHIHSRWMHGKKRWSSHSLTLKCP